MHKGNLSSDYLAGFREVCRILQKTTAAPEKGVSRKMIQESITRYALVFYAEASALMRAKKYREAAKMYGVAFRIAPGLGQSIDWGKRGGIIHNHLRPYGAWGRAVIKCLYVTLFKGIRQNMPGCRETVGN